MPSLLLFPLHFQQLAQLLRRVTSEKREREEREARFVVCSKASFTSLAEVSESQLTTPIQYSARPFFFPRIASHSPARDLGIQGLVISGSKTTSRLQRNSISHVVRRANRLSIRRIGYILLSHAKRTHSWTALDPVLLFVPHQLFFHHCIFLHNEFDEEFACSALVMANVEMDVIRGDKEEPSSVEAAVGDVGGFKMQSIAERDDAGLRRVGKQPVLKV